MARKTSQFVGAAVPTMSKDSDARERKYRAEDALRTLSRADEIRSDKGLMRDVKSHAKQQIKVASKVLGTAKPPRVK